MVFLVFLSLNDRYDTCDSCDTFFVGPGYRSNVVVDALSKESDVICKDCAEKHHAVSTVFGKELDEKKLLKEYKPIKEVNGHTPLEVIFGCILGIVVGLAFSLL